MKPFTQLIENSRRSFWFYQWTGWAAFYIFDLIGTYRMFDSPVDLASWFLSNSIGFMLSLVLRRIYQPVYERKSPVVLGLSALLFPVLAATAWLFLRDFCYSLFLPGNKISEYAWTYLGDHLRLLSMVIYFTVPLFGWSVLYFGLKFSLGYSDEKQRAALLLAQARDAQLRLLRYQVNPHFLFNALNSVQALIYENPKDADEMIGALSEFFRHSLTRDHDTYLPLAEELGIAERYLKIESVRFGKDLRYEVHIDPATKDLEVLCFILQPMVENAVKHGMTAGGMGISIQVTAQLKDQSLLLCVKNTGQWKEARNGEGKGLDNLRQRLRTAYGEDQALVVKEEEGFVVAKVKIKYRT